LLHGLVFRSQCLFGVRWSATTDKSPIAISNSVFDTFVSRLIYLIKSRKRQQQQPSPHSKLKSSFAIQTKITFRTRE
jgi:hypothetical protein